MEIHQLRRVAQALFCLLWTLSHFPAFASDGSGRWTDTVESLPAELGADLLIRAAGPGGPVKDKEERSRLLSQAFELAGKAVEPFAKVSRGKMLGESRAGFTELSAQAGLSRLALQCRVTRSFLDLDPGAARSYLEKIQRPVLTEASCGDLLTGDVSEYYATAGAVLRAAGGEGAPAFLYRLAEELQSPVQLAPMARLLADAPESPATMKQAVESFAYHMGSMKSAEPAFRYAVITQQLALQVEALGRKLGPGSSLSALVLLGFRDFLVNQLTGRACHESFLAEGRRQIQAAAIAPFNDRLRLPGVLSKEGLPELNYEELWPQDADNTQAVVPGFWREGKAEMLWQQLTRDPAEPRAPDSEILSPEQVAAEALRWQWPGPEEMPEEEFFHQKVLLWRRAALTMPAGEKLQESIRAMAGFLGGNPMQARVPAEWLWYVQVLMHEKAIGAAMRQAFFEAGDPALRAYAELP